MKNKKQILVMTVLVGLLQPVTSSAGEWGVGFNVNNSPTFYKDHDDDLALNIFPEYRGERFNLDHESISYSVLSSGSYNLEVLGKSLSLGYEDDDSKVLKGMKDRDSSINLGLRASYSTDYGLLSLHALTDVLGNHKGQEIELRFGEPFYTEHWSGQRELTLGAFAGVRWQSDDLIDYYYGVKDSETTASRKAFKGESAITSFVGMELKFGFSEHLSLEGAVSYEHLPDKITDSSIASSNGMRGRLGLTYWF